MAKGYRVEFRCSEAAGAVVEDFAKRTGVSRSEAWRQIMKRGLDAYAEQTSAVIQGGLSKEGEMELRQWRAFADRTAVNGDPERQVTPDIDMHGWTFLVMPQRDEHLDIA